MIQAEPERIQIHVMELYPENYEFEGFPKYKRSPRIIKRLPKDTIDIQTPMEKSVMGKGSLVQMILPPLLMTAVTIISSLVMKMGGFVIVTALTTVLTTIFTVTKYFDDRKACRQKNKRREELYEDYLVTKRKELNHAREKEIEAWSYNYPQIDEMERLIREYSPRIYERNIHDEDFMTVAVGYWDAEVNFKIDYENNAMKYETDELEEEGEHLKEIFGKIPQKPMIVDLKKAHLGIVGDRENVHEQLQILLTQLVFAQSYHDLQIITIYDKEYEEEFSWMKWLPHSKIRALNLRGLINSEQMRDQVLGSILQILKDRKMKCEEKKNEARFAPYFLFVIDEPKLISSQPDFMAELISTARIGRSLGVHLILATQKPSGVVDDQIWSNSKFKLALKVQDEADSREILKTADAAFITQPGRAYLQVGNNEIYELFQSAWSGATVEAGGMSEQIDDRVYKINELGQGELLNENLDDESESGEKRTQLEAVVDYIEEIFEEQHCEKVPKPWLPSLPFKMISTIQEIKAMEKLDLSFPLVLGDQGNAEIFPVPYQEKIEFTKGLLFRNGVSTKIMIPKC